MLLLEPRNFPGFLFIYQLSSVKNYFSLVKFSHTVFALPFAVIGFFLGVKHTGSPPNWTLFVKVLLCMVFARTSAMAFNRFADREVDAENARTRSREIPSGVIRPAAALTLVILSALLFIITTYTINTLCFYLSPVAITVVLGYSLTKRFTALCHFILGLGLSLAPIGAYLSVTGEFNPLPLLFSACVLMWVSGFDIIYALQDEDFDKQHKLFSIPAAVGKKTALMISNVAHALSGILIIIAGAYASLGILYWIGAAVFIALLIYQHTLVKPNDLRKINVAFFTTNGIASVVFAIFVLFDLLRQ
jgi:4-hydroxybenzoate polyprenyltransferase